eukprot:jgi/Astpho2/7489/Aster-02061
MSQVWHTWIVRAAETETEEDVDVEEEAMEKFEKSLESVQRSFSTIRTGRASPTMLDRVQVDYYGASTPLKQLAGISVPEATMLVVQPYDKTALPEIERAIVASDLGITPSNDGNLIRLKVPALTADRRKEMGKLASKYGEDGKVALRNVRRDAMKLIDKLEKDKKISEDEQKALEEAVQELTDDYVKQVDKLIKNKQEELMKV